MAPGIKILITLLQFSFILPLDLPLSPDKSLRWDNRLGNSDGKRSIFRSRSESTIMNGTKNGTIVLNEKTERAVKAAFGAQNFIVNHKMRRESASESIFYNVKLKIIKQILPKRNITYRYIRFKRNWFVIIQIEETIDIRLTPLQFFLIQNQHITCKKFLFT